MNTLPSSPLKCCPSLPAGSPTLPEASCSSPKALRPEYLELCHPGCRYCRTDLKPCILEITLTLSQTSRLPEPVTAGRRRSGACKRAAFPLHGPELRRSRCELFCTTSIKIPQTEGPSRAASEHHAKVSEAVGRAREN